MIQAIEQKPKQSEIKPEISSSLKMIQGLLKDAQNTKSFQEIQESDKLGFINFLKTIISFKSKEERDEFLNAPTTQVEYRMIFQEMQAEKLRGKNTLSKEELLNLNLTARSEFEEVIYKINRKGNEATQKILVDLFDQLRNQYIIADSISYENIKYAISEFSKKDEANVKISNAFLALFAKHKEYFQASSNEDISSFLESFMVESNIPNYHDIYQLMQDSED